MSESVNSGQGNKEAEVDQNEAGNAAEGVPAEPEKILMFEYNYETADWEVAPNFNQYFQTQSQINFYMGDAINDKWSEYETNVYLGYVQARQGLINSVYTKQIRFYEDYEAWISYYANNSPLGDELYQKQLKYLQYLQEKDMKMNKPKVAVAPKGEKPKVLFKEDEKEKVVNRTTTDPDHNLQKLMTTDWDAKYVSTSILAKENANIVFIGHVDSGKSTLTGNIIKELKEVDEQELTRNKAELKQNKMEAWEFAAISDIIPEERVDGKTREYAKLNFTLEKKRFTLFDAPGHKNYVPNMIMGACQADVAVLIISAKEGEFESGFEKEGQTKEHAMLAKALGVIELVVVVSKMGTVGWSEKRFTQIKEQVAPFLENSCGFHKVAFIPVDSIENSNIHTQIESSWYKGTCFLDYLDNITLPERKPMGPLRIPVIDKFKDVGILYAYGKIESGTIVEDQTVTILPQRTQMVIREIYNAKDERLPFACAGDNVKLRVKNIDENDISRGDMICNNLNYCQQSAEFKANVTILELPDEKKLVSSGYECVIHMHAIAAQVEISKIEARIDKATGKKVAAGFLKPGEKGLCQIKIEQPICLEKHEFMPSLGRFTLRDEGKTIGFGQITGIKPAKALFQEQKEHLTKEKVEGEEVAKKVEKMSLNENAQ